MGDVDVSILEHMRNNIKGGFDEDKHGPRIGFGNLRRLAANLSLVSLHITLMQVTLYIHHA